jgi:sugar O-acyltransferase (sialic acid O-acetyltransferase NeuD family)
MIYLYGASGHGIVIQEICKLNNLLIGSFIDDNSQKKYFYNLPVIHSDDFLMNENDKLLISIGDNKIRNEIGSKYKEYNFFNAIHPSAILSKDIKFGFGISIMAGTIINPLVQLGNHVIINSSACIEHECIINDYSHISPGAVLSGNVNIGEGTHVGSGAIVIPNITIGKWCVIGAGSVITKDIPDYSLVVGVPGKIIKKLSND